MVPCWHWAFIWLILIMINIKSNSIPVLYQYSVLWWYEPIESNLAFKFTPRSINCEQWFAKCNMHWTKGDKCGVSWFHPVIIIVLNEPWHINLSNIITLKSLYYLLGLEEIQTICQLEMVVYFLEFVIRTGLMSVFKFITWFLKYGIGRVESENKRTHLNDIQDGRMSSHFTFHSWKKCMDTNFRTNYRNVCMVLVSLIVSNDKQPKQVTSC